MLTTEQLVKILTIPEQRAAIWCPHLVAAMEQSDIATPLRMVHFLAQIGHESGRLKYTKEIWADSPMQQRYEMSPRLGNTEVGDGKKFMGRGPVQLTGRRNYALASAALGVDFVDQPHLVERMDYGCQVAGWFWQHGAGMNLGKRALDALGRLYGTGACVDLNEVADQDDIETITLCINGRLNGYEDRLKIYLRAKQILGV